MSREKHMPSQPELEEVLEQDLDNDSILILHNDEVHTFDYVIESLIKVCKMDEVQAEQCTLLVHYKGKCDIKKGSFDYLNPFRQALIARGLESTIE